MEAVEINTEGWESRPGQSEFVDQSADSPFQVVRVDEEQELTQEEKEEKETGEIVKMYQTKNGEPVVKHKSFFDELWEKNHPDEAKKVKEEEKQRKKEEKEEREKKAKEEREEREAKEKKA